MKNIKKIALYNPYLDVMGGGEKHILSILKVFGEEGFEVDILWDDIKIQKEVSNFKLVPNFIRCDNFYSRFIKTKEYHSFFYLTDGSYFFSGADNNYVFCMYPQKNLYSDSPFNKLKWSNFKFIANSEYTAKFIKSWINKPVKVIYPYIDESFFLSSGPVKKEKIILSVGRFFQHLHAKKQDFLIEAFKKLKQTDKAFNDFKLIMAGKVKPEDENYFKSLLKLASSDKNITLIANIDQAKLLNYYKKSLFFWHGAGAEVNLANHPEATEHLGIAPLEAMAAGIISFCHDSGGPHELIKDAATGFLYQSLDDLVKKTSTIYKDKDKIEKISVAGRKFVESNFSYHIFRNNVKSYFDL